MKEKPLRGTKILTTNPEERIGLYAIRYLGRAGAQVSTVSHQSTAKQPIGFLSKYAYRKIRAPQENFASGLKRFLIEHQYEYDVIDPIDVSSMLSVLNLAQETSGLFFTHLLPRKESLIIADNKELLIQHSSKIGLACPKTFFRISPDEIQNLSHFQLTFPCIIKFRGDNRESHWAPDQRYSIVLTRQQLVEEYRRMHKIEPYPIIQEYISGQGFGYFALYDKSQKVKAHFCHKRIREYPITGGPSSCCESYYHPELVRIGRRLLESLDWTGLAMVEFKYDPSRHNFYIIEVNPRYWGSLPLAVMSGVNFPVLHALSALEQDYAPVLQYRLGTKVRFLNNDVKSIIESISLETNWKTKFRTLLSLFDFRIRDGLFALDDLRPVLHGILNSITRS